MVERKKFLKVRRKLFINKRNGQGTITLPKRKIKKLDPTIKFDKDLFVEIRLLRGKS